MSESRALAVQDRSQGLAVAGPSNNLPHLIKLANLLSEASMAPTAYQGKPGNVLMVALWGEAVGLNPAVAMWGSHVIDNKPSPSANMMGALIRQRGHRLRVTGDASQATATLNRADDPEFTYSTTWTLERARTAGLLGNKNWQKDPGQMLKRRAVSEIGRDACPEVLFGMHTPDELGYLEDAQGEALLGPDGAPVRATVEPVEKKAPAGRSYTQIGISQDVPVEASKRGKKTESVQAELLDETPPAPKESIQALRKRAYDAAVFLWGDRAESQVVEALGGPLKMATFEQCYDLINKIEQESAAPPEADAGFSDEADAY